jgi:hypothetical protein
LRQMGLETCIGLLAPDELALPLNKVITSRLMNTFKDKYFSRHQAPLPL